MNCIKDSIFPKTEAPSKQNKNGILDFERWLSCEVFRPNNEDFNLHKSEGVNSLYHFIKKHPEKKLPAIVQSLRIPIKTLERWIKKIKV